MKAVFLDTYAMFEIAKGNEAYKPYLELQAATTKWNLLELYYTILIKFGREKAEFEYDKFAPYAIEFDDDTVKEAGIFRAQNPGRRLSYADCLGYTIAKRLEIPFLTGDQQFENMENVEYIK